MSEKAKQPVLSVGTPTRNVLLDLLKALAIVAVVLYHCGLLPYGYLGVDIFLVINGFLIAKSILREEQKGTYHPVRFFLKRLARLWPLILIAGVVCLIAGYFTMLPDDFENAAESVIASNFFGNNVLACITTKNYWDVVNNYKPLMHFWYVDVIVQSYVLFALIPLLFRKAKQPKTSRYLIVFSALTAVSLALYLLPNFTSAQKFYYPPFRLFEFTLGASVACLPLQHIEQSFADKRKRIAVILLFIVLLLCFLMSPAAIPDTVKLLTVCVLVGAFLVFCGVDPFTPGSIPSRTADKIALLGKASFSIFVWHQVVLAFLRNIYSAAMTWQTFLLFLLLTAALAVPSYLLIEQKLCRCRTNKKMTALLCGCLVAAVLSSGAAFLIYRNAGVVRDVPELGIEKSNIRRGMHAQYNDRIYSYDVDFSAEDKIHVLVCGDSFGRDWANILLESSLADQIELSYIYTTTDEGLERNRARLENADYIFIAFSSLQFKDLKAIYQPYYQAGKVYIIGNKNYGENNGPIYNRRFSEDYLQSDARVPDPYLIQNNELQRKFGDHYIDMLAPVLTSENTVRVFDSNGHFLSQDCRHLTQFGAAFYASTLDLSFIH